MIKDLSQPTPIYSYMKNPSLIDFPGVMAVIFFVNVCNFRCKFCHNRSLIDTPHNLFTYEYLQEILKKYKDDWTEGVVVSGGEPCVHEGIYDLIEFISNMGFKIKLDTNGSFPERLKKVLPLVDYVAMDLKCSFENYPVLSNFKNTDKIKESIELLKSSGKPFELRTTVLSNFHTLEEAKRMVPILQGIDTYYLQPYIPREEVYDLAFCPDERTPLPFLKDLEKFFNENGVNAKIR